MFEVWVKKTIYRRYLVENSDIDTVKAILKENDKKAEELIGDIYDCNNSIEYDDEKIQIPVSFEIHEINKEVEVKE